MFIFLSRNCPWQVGSRLNLTIFSKQAGESRSLGQGFSLKQMIVKLPLSLPFTFHGCKLRSPHLPLNGLDKLGSSCSGRKGEEIWRLPQWFPLYCSMNTYWLVNEEKSKPTSKHGPQWDQDKILAWSTSSETHANLSFQLILAKTHL